MSKIKSKAFIDDDDDDDDEKPQQPAKKKIAAPTKKAPKKSQKVELKFPLILNPPISIIGKFTW